jgi:murein DD-endopeptidase MepM/ murein hydrolase activator NlpD
MNRHVDAPSQRRAADLVRLGTDGSTHRGKGDANADYYAYGEDVIAVADGTVVTAIDGIPENTPGEVNPEMLTGNAIIVQHTPSLYSLYAHLKTGSVRVKVGTKVKRGQTLGLCGNSGNSTEPHLHFQLQDAARFDKSWGVEPVFAGVSITRDGQTTAASDYTFLKGDRVRAAK